jgi:syntaxin 16
LFLISKKAVEKIDTSRDPRNEEELMKRNLKISLVNELNTLSLDFRDEQAEYLKNMERMKAKRRENKTKYDEEETDLDPEEQERIQQLEQKLQADPGFTDEQIRELIMNEQDIIRRDKELREILTSIVELNELFKEFSQLVVEQGTLLDRIDYNIETTHDFMVRANVDLNKAETYQKMSRLTLCVLVLILLVVGVGLFFALKIFLRVSTGGIL